MTGETKLPRLYTTQDLRQGQPVALDEAQAHYLRAVLRRQPGDRVRLFNGRDGEWRAALEFHGKKSAAARPEENLRGQPQARRQTHLLFAPIKKGPMEWLVEKAVELGATHLHPVITARTEARHVSEERLRRQIVEAAEQCERLDMPALEPPAALERKLQEWPAGTPVLACVERSEAVLLSPSHAQPPCLAFLTGPEGGFMEAEKKLMTSFPFVTAVSLGEGVLRAETAAAACLAMRLLTGGG